ncbi:MAG: stage V sporulation T C-terminal domain-containing protein [Oscillospiraceae bacterium]
MKATGIVRRIDDLGRVVIPKEIRRTQMIRVGDPLEIFVNAEGDVIFKKYSPIGELALFAQKCTDALYKTANITVAVADRDCIVAVCQNKKELQNAQLAEGYDKLLEQRRVYVPEASKCCVLSAAPPIAALALAPIVCQGDLIGSVALLACEGEKPSENEIKIIQLIASILAKQMEE